MVTTCGKGTHKAKTAGDAEKSTIAKKDKTYLTEHQPASPKASLEQPRKGHGHPRKVTAIDGPTIHKDQTPAPIDDLPCKYVRNDAKPASEVENQPVPKCLKTNDADVPQVPCKQRKAGDTWKGAVVPPRDPLPDL